MIATLFFVLFYSLTFLVSKTRIYCFERHSLFHLPDVDLSVNRKYAVKS